MSQYKDIKTLKQLTYQHISKTDLARRQVELSKSCHTIDLLRVIAKYLDDITKIIYCAKTYKEEVLISCECLKFLKDIVFQDQSFIAKFLKRFTEKILITTIEEDVTKWVFKKEILKLFNFCLQKTKRSVKNDIIKNLNEIYLLKLFDSISTLSDYDFQVVLIEGIFRLYTKAFIITKLKHIFPESEELCQKFAEIKPNTFDEDVRFFLNLLNKGSGKICSIVCKSIQMEDIVCQPPLDSVNGLWIDFNLLHPVISWYCIKDSFNKLHEKNEEDATIWTLITLFGEDIEDIDILQQDDKSHDIISIKLKSHCLCSNEDVQIKIDKIKNIQILLHKTKESSYVLNNVMPNMVLPNSPAMSKINIIKSPTDFSDFFCSSKITRHSRQLYSQHELECSILNATEETICETSSSIRQMSTTGSNIDSITVKSVNIVDNEDLCKQFNNKINAANEKASTSISANKSNTAILKERECQKKIDTSSSDNSMRFITSEPSRKMSSPVLYIALTRMNTVPKPTNFDTEVTKSSHSIETESTPYNNTYSKILPNKKIIIHSQIALKAKNDKKMEINTILPTSSQSCDMPNVQVPIKIKKEFNFNKSIRNEIFKKYISIPLIRYNFEKINNQKLNITSRRQDRKLKGKPIFGEMIHEIDNTSSNQLILQQKQLETVDKQYNNKENYQIITSEQHETKNKMKKTRQIDSKTNEIVECQHIISSSENEIGRNILTVIAEVHNEKEKTEINTFKKAPVTENNNNDKHQKVQVDKIKKIYCNPNVPIKEHISFFDNSLAVSTSSNNKTTNKKIINKFDEITVLRENNLDTEVENISNNNQKNLSRNYFAETDVLDNPSKLKKTNINITSNTIQKQHRKRNHNNSYNTLNATFAETDVLNNRSKPKKTNINITSNTIQKQHRKRNHNNSYNSLNATGVLEMVDSLRSEHGGRTILDLAENRKIHAEQKKKHKISIKNVKISRRTTEAPAKNNNTDSFVTNISTSRWKELISIFQQPGQSSSKRSNLTHRNTTNEDFIWSSKKRKLPVPNENIIYTMVGEPAPKWQGAALVDENVVTIKSDDFLGEYAIIVFYTFDLLHYPKEIQDFNEKAKQFKAINCQVISCSFDSLDSHLALVKKIKEETAEDQFEVILLSDTNHQISNAFNVDMVECGNPVTRVFIINPKGIILMKISHKTAYTIDVNFILQEVKNLQTIDMQLA